MEQLSLMLQADTTGLVVLLIMNMCDMVSALPKIIEYGYQSHKMKSGLVNKAMIYLAIVVTGSLDYLLSLDGKVLICVTYFFIANEGLSVIENIGGYIPIPSVLKKLLTELRDENGGDKDE